MLGAAVLFSCTTLQAQSRKVSNCDYGWSFTLKKAKPTDPVNNKKWKKVILPHDWSVEEGYTVYNTSGATGYLPGGLGWYRKDIKVPVSDKGRKLYLAFDGVYRDAKVFLNGKQIYNRPYGYSSFWVDLSDKLNYGAVNKIAVSVDRRKYEDSRWYPGSGINRHVRWMSLPATHIGQWGVAITTPKVTKSRATVAVSTEYVVSDQAASDASLLPVKIRTEILDAKGKVVSKKITSLKNATQDGKVAQSISIKKPLLWDIKKTNMYKARVALLDKSDKVIDTVTRRFGVRTFRFDKEKGFFLNGKNMKLKGICMHMDMMAAGTAVTKEMWRHDLQLLKEMGCNAIRCSHNPPSPEFLELCDEMGFLVQDEIFDEWRQNKNKWTHNKRKTDEVEGKTWGYAEIYEEWAERDVKDWVKRDINHPSIIMWSAGNEIEWTYPYYWRMEKSNQGLNNAVLNEMGGDKRELTKTALEIQDWVKSIDTTRPTTSGMVSPNAGYITGYVDALDLAGYNYRAGYYKTHHDKYPDRIIYGSENWPQYHEWKSCLDNDHICGVFIWTGIAYLGEASFFPKRGGGYGAFIDLGGFARPNYYLYQSLWTDKPVLRMFTQPLADSNYLVKNGKVVEDPNNPRDTKWSWPDVRATWNYQKGEQIFTELYTNCVEVELFLNGRSLGVQKLADQKDGAMKWATPYEKGVLLAKGKMADGEVVTYSLKSLNQQAPYGIKLVSQKSKLKNDGQDVAVVCAYLVDADGTVIEDQDVEMSFDIKGDVRYIGVANGGPCNPQPFKAYKTFTDHGRCSIMLQSTKKTGFVEVRAYMKNGQEAIFTLGNNPLNKVGPRVEFQNWKGKGRIAISSDGNEHDHDDWAATPMSLALLASQGLQDKLAIYTYSDHVWGSNKSNKRKIQNMNHYEHMNKSALEGKKYFGFDKTRFICAVDNPEKAYNSMRDEINKSSKENPLYIVAAGPMQVVGEAINRADKSKRRFVTVLSHSGWNDKHSDKPGKWEKPQHTGWTWDDMKAAFSDSKGGKVRFVHIKDQNGGRDYLGLNCDKKLFDWVKTSPARNNPLYKKGSWDFLYNRLESCLKKKGKNFDPSDAGMILFMLTGVEKTNPEMAKFMMENPKPKRK